MSQVTYNSITLPLCRTEQFQQEPVRADDDRNYHYMRYTIRVASIFNPDVWISEFVGQPPAVTMALIRHRLAQPRKPFQFLIEDPTTGIAAIPLLNVLGQDIVGGPIPTVHSIEEIVGTQTFRVVWSVVVCTLECTSALANIIVSNVWAQDWSMDQDANSIRITRGRLTIKNEYRGAIEQFRDLAIPPLPKDWVRESISLSYAPDWLSFSYVITDKQVHTTPIRPATSMDGHYATSCDNGMLVSAEMELTASAPQDVHKRTLLGKMLRVIGTRFNLSADAKDVVQHGSISESLFRNELTVRYRVICSSGQQVENHFLTRKEFLGKDLKPTGDDDLRNFDDRGPWGSSHLTATMQAFVEACTAEESNDPNGGTSGNQTGGIEGLGHGRPWNMPPALAFGSAYVAKIQNTVVEVTPGVLNTTKELPYTMSHKVSPYRRAEGNSKHVTRSHTLVLPVASNPTETTPTNHDVVVMAPNITERHIEFRMARNGARPELPRLVDTVDGDGNKIVMLEKEMTVEDPHLRADGNTLEHIVFGEAVLVSENPRKFDETFNDLPGFKGPWIQGPAYNVAEFGIKKTDPIDGMV